MTSNLVAVTFDANAPLGLARFWAGVLDWELRDDEDDIAILPRDDTGFQIWFASTVEQKRAPNQLHFDLTTPPPADQQRTVERSLELGGRHIDIGQTPDEGHVVLADPEGNEFCVIEPDNTFLADTGIIGAINCDGTQEVGYFWSKALGWPLVWDQDQETAIQSPLGGSKMSWGGRPANPKTGKNRLHLEIPPPADADQLVEVDRLVSLGATRIDIGQGDVSWVVM